MSGAKDNPDIAKFLSSQKVGVLATASLPGAKPHAASVYYTIDSELNIYFITRSQTTKFNNLQSNPHAAFVVYDVATQTTVQIQGIVKVIEDKAFFDKVFQEMTAYSKQTSGTETLPVTRIEPGEYVLFRIRPQSLRLADYKYSPDRYLFETGTQAEQPLG